MRSSLASVASLAFLTLAACGSGGPVPQSNTSGSRASTPPAGASSATRLNITLESHGAWGLLTEADGTCPGATGGIDTLTGIVTLTEIGVDGIKYSGELKRTTHVGLCETRDTPDGTKWCAGDLNGHGPFLVNVTVPLSGHDNENASVEMKPGHGAHADVAGHCDSLDNGAVKADYEDGDTLYFETANHAASRVLPTGGLVPGTWSQSRRDPDTGYKLVVTAVP
jgi:hypothetical protein